MASDGTAVHTVAGVAALRQVAAALGATTGRVRPNPPFPITTVWAGDDRLLFAASGAEVSCIVELPTAVTGEHAFQLSTRMLGTLLRTLPSGRAEITHDTALRVRLGRLDYSLATVAISDEPPALPTTGVTVDNDDYLNAFRRVVHAAASGVEAPSERTIRIRPEGADLRLDFDAFERSATDLIEGQAGSFGSRLVSVDVHALAALVKQFDLRFAKLTISTTPHADSVWIVSTRRRSRVTIAVQAGIALVPARDPRPLLDDRRTCTTMFDARALRSAMRRIALAHAGAAQGGPYITMRFGDGSQDCCLLTNGGFASAAEFVPCHVSGKTPEVTVRYQDLWAAIALIRGPLLIAFDTDDRPIVISDTKHYRCFLRRLPQPSPGEPLYRGANQNVPFPRATHVNTLALP